MAAHTKERLKGIGYVLIGFLALLLMLGIGLGLLVGATKASLWLTQWLPWVVLPALAISIFILAPLALVPAARVVAAFGFLIASYAFGASVWIWGLAYTYETWGVIAVIIGLVVLGVGVVPIALIAALIHGDWGNLATFLVMIVATFGSRGLAAWLAVKADERARRRQETALQQIRGV